MNVGELIKDKFKRFTEKRKALFNIGVTNLLNESMTFAKSWTFGSGALASMWEYKTHLNRDGVISSVTITNTYVDVKRSNKAQAIWDMLEDGRKAYTINKEGMFLPIYNYRTGRFGVWTNKVNMPEYEGLHPLERTTKHFVEKLKNFIKQLHGTNWGKGANPNNIIVDALPNISNRRMIKQSVTLKSELAYGSYYYNRPKKRQRTSTLIRKYYNEQFKNFADYKKRTKLER